MSGEKINPIFSRRIRLPLPKRLRAGRLIECTQICAEDLSATFSAVFQSVICGNVFSSTRFFEAYLNFPCTLLYANFLENLLLNDRTKIFKDIIFFQQPLITYRRIHACLLICEHHLSSSHVWPET